VAGRSTPAARDLFWEFARAETASERFAHTLRPKLDTPIVQALDADDRTRLSDFEWDKLALGVLSLRAPLTLGPLLLGTMWRYDSVPPQELASVRFVHMADFESVAPSRTIKELAERVRAGAKFPHRDEGDFGEMVLRRAHDFDPAKLRGALILLSEDGAPPYLLIEGLTRATALTVRTQLGEPAPPTIRALIGTCARLSDWRFA
jgi:hypothetical protein